MFKGFVESFIKERNYWFLWAPVFFGIGIVIYFQLSFEPSYQIIAYPICLVLVSLLVARENIISLAIVAAMIFTILGFLAIMYKANSLYHKSFPYENYYVKFTGKINEIQPLSKGIRAIITDLEFENPVIPKTVQKIRVTFKHQKTDFKIGSRVRMSAFLSTPPRPITPSSYNFKRFAFFEGIDAVGICTTKVENLSNQDIKFFSIDHVNQIRNFISSDLLSKYGNKVGSVIASLMIGEYSSIERNLLNDMRISGLAHILSVSGLHLTLVTTMAFFLLRFLLNLNNFIALEFNVKKIAAFGAIIISFLYLMISGSYVAAVRSFIMTTTFLFAIIVDRENTSMRSVAISALIILILFPELIVHPSFQMSFGAVIAMISFYESSYSKKIITLSNYSFFYRIIYYFLSSLVTSFIAGFSISPFIAYHFGQFSQYSIIANLLVVPVVSFFIMPLVMLGLLFYPFFLKDYILSLLKYGIDYLIYIASYVSNLPQSNHVTPNISDFSITLFVIGGIWLCLWQQKWRLLGLIPILLSGILPFIFQNHPDFIMTDNKSMLFSMLDNKNRLILSKQIRSELKVKSLLQIYGKDDYMTLDKYYFRDLDYYCRDSDNCYYSKNGYKIHMNYQNNRIYNNCENVDLVIMPNSWKVKNYCASQIITKYDLKKKGTHLIYLKKKLKITNVLDRSNKRLWDKNHLKN